MKRYIFLIIFLFIGLIAKSQYRGLYFEASQYFQLGDSTVTVWGDDTLTSPAMVRAIIEYYFNKSVGNNNEVQLSDGLGGFKAIGNGKEFNYDGSIFSVGDYNGDAYNYIYLDSASGIIDLATYGAGGALGLFNIYGQSGSDFSIYIDEPTNGANIEIAADISVISDPDIIISATDGTLLQGLHINKYGAYFENFTPTQTSQWTDPYLITKGYADENYGIDSVLANTSDTIQFIQDTVFANGEEGSTSVVIKVGGIALGNSEVMHSLLDIGKVAELLKENTITVSPLGGTFTTIKEAIDSINIAGSGSTNRWLISVYPGVYTEDNTVPL